MKRFFSLMLCLSLVLSLMLTSCGLIQSLIPNVGNSNQNTDNGTDTPPEYTPIEPDDFCFNEDEFPANISDAIAQALLKKADPSDKHYSGKSDKYDGFYFCYYATDDFGNVFLADKMDAANPTCIQLGLSSLDGLEKVISDRILSLEGNIHDYIYSTSTVPTVGDNDAISVSYTKLWSENECNMSQTVNHEYVELDYEVNDFYKSLIGKPIGVILGDITVEETAGYESATYTYQDVKIESIIKDNSTDTVKIGDTVSVTYTISFDARKYYNKDWQQYDLPDPFNNGFRVNEEGIYSETRTLEIHTVRDSADSYYYEDAIVSSLIGKNVGEKYSMSFEYKSYYDEAVDLNITDIQVNWIANSDINPIKFNYVLFPEELNDEYSNKKILLSTKGEKVILNGEELTFYVFPVYYVDIDINTEEIFSNFTSTAAYYENTENGKVYALDSFNDNGFKNGDKPAAEYIDELGELNALRIAKEKELEEALTALFEAQYNLANDPRTSYSETVSLSYKEEIAHENYSSILHELNDITFKMDNIIHDILNCKKGEISISDCLVSDLEKYVNELLFCKE